MNIHVSIEPSLIIHVSLIFQTNSWNHSTDKFKSQFFATYVYLSSALGTKVSNYLYTGNIDNKLGTKTRVS